MKVYLVDNYGVAFKNKEDAVAYMNRCAKGKDAETKARIWNGGLKGAESSSTEKYWAKVKSNL